SPGLASIEAVLDPPEGAWEYWVTVNLLSGETLFAETYAEHLENVALLDKWIEEHGMPESSRPDDAEERGERFGAARGRARAPGRALLVPGPAPCGLCTARARLALRRDRGRGRCS